MVAANTFSNLSDGLTSPIQKQFAITPHNTDELTSITRGLYVGVSGDVVCILNGDTSAVTLKGMAGGIWHPLRVKVLKSTGTTATDLVGGY